MSDKIYPIGIQNFEKLRKEGYFYIDKTALIYKMVRPAVITSSVVRAVSGKVCWFLLWKPISKARENYLKDWP